VLEEHRECVGIYGAKKRAAVSWLRGVESVMLFSELMLKHRTQM